MYFDHIRNIQTSFSYVMMSVWTVIQLFMTKSMWIIRLWKDHDCHFQTGYPIYKIVEKSEILQSTVSHDILVKYLTKFITVYHGQCSGQLQVLNDYDQRSLTRIVCGNRKTTVAPQIISTFNAWGTRCISRRSDQCFLASIGYGNTRLTKKPLLAHKHIIWTCDITNRTLEIR